MNIIETIHSPLQDGKSLSSGGLVTQVLISPELYATFTPSEKKYLSLTARVKFRHVVSIAHHLNDGLSFRDAVIKTLKS